MEFAGPSTMADDFFAVLFDPNTEDHVGNRVLITIMEDGIYQGDICSVDKNYRSFSLKKVEEQTTGRKFGKDILTFQAREIYAAEFLETKKKVKPCDRRGGLQVDSSCLEATSDKNCSTVLSSGETHESSTNNVVTIPSVQMSSIESSGPSLPRNSSPKHIANRGLLDGLVGHGLSSAAMRANPVFLQKLDEDFDTAIQSINEEDVIGVAVQGSPLGRRGHVHLLLVATGKCVFVFDILILDVAAFEKGLGEILENPNIVKVLHDCRWASDALYHKYELQLVNVYDTQVADYMVYKAETQGRIPRIPRRLLQCLADYLNLDKQCLNCSKGYHSEENAYKWQARPLPDPEMMEAVDNVVYLRELRLATLKCMLQEFTSGVEVYLKDIRNTKDDDVGVMPPHLLPISLQQPEEVCRPYARRRFFQPKPRNLLYGRTIDEILNKSTTCIKSSRSLAEVIGDLQDNAATTEVKRLPEPVKVVSWVNAQKNRSEAEQHEVAQQSKSITPMSSQSEATANPTPTSTSSSPKESVPNKAAQDEFHDPVSRKIDWKALRVADQSLGSLADTGRSLVIHPAGYYPEPVRKAQKMPVNKKNVGHVNVNPGLRLGHCNPSAIDIRATGCGRGKLFELLQQLQQLKGS